MSGNDREKDFLKRLWATFQVEAQEHIKAISSGLLELEKSRSIENQSKIIETIYRRAHSLKGSSRAVDLTAIETICQSLESIFKEFKYKGFPDSPEMFDGLQRAVDAVETIVTKQEEMDVTPIILELEQIKNLTFNNLSLPAKDQPNPPTGKHDYISSPSNLGGRFSQQDGLPLVINTFNTQPEQLKEHVEKTIKETKTDPSQEMVITHRDTRKQTITETLVEPVKEDVEKKSREPLKLSGRKTESDTTIRVTSDKLDRLMLQSEEMIFMKLALNHRISELKEMSALLRDLKKRRSKMDLILKSLRKSKPGSSGSEEFKSLSEYVDYHRASMKLVQGKLNHVMKSLQTDQRIFNGLLNTHMDDIRKTLMLPFSSLTEGFPRMVRDISRQNSKEAELVIHGNEIEIDKRILEEMKDPLVHLIRNALDHGLELPAERLKKAKPACGRITLDISRKESDKVEIVISDDGGGIQLERIKSKALSSGYYNAEEIEQVSDFDLMNLIFDSEFSTSPIITDLSGRGLGLAIVCEKVEKLGGRIGLESIPGKGTIFRILLHTTLATFRGILVESAGHRFIIPTLNVEQVLNIQPKEIRTVENRETIYWGNEILSFVRLDDVLRLNVLKAAKEFSGFYRVVILGVGDRRIAFQVDEVLNEEEILVKGLGKQLVRVRNISGATVLGSGDVVLILYAVDLLKSVVSISSSPRKIPEISGAEGEKMHEVPTTNKSILVVEDSITSRMLLKNILESTGYDVRVAVDGMDGWIAVKEKSFDLVVLDVEMPGMSGFELTEKIRQDRNLNKIPVVLVTALESREDRERGIEVGADAYIVKSSFDQSNLLDVVRKLI